MPSLAGSFLIARPSLREPTFTRTVIVILAHDENGALGLVVNRPTKLKGVPFPVYVGGPCQSPGLFMLHGEADWTSEDSEGPDSAREVVPGVFVGDATCLQKVTDTPAAETSRFRVFTGYAGWSGGQLERELSEGTWLAIPASSQLLFETPVDDLWSRLAPPAIPEPSLN